MNGFLEHTLIHVPPFNVRQSCREMRTICVLGCLLIVLSASQELGADYSELGSEDFAYESPTQSDDTQERHEEGHLPATVNLVDVASRSGAHLNARSLTAETAEVARTKLLRVIHSLGRRHSVLLGEVGR